LLVGAKRREGGNELFWAVFQAVSVEGVQFFRERPIAVMASRQDWTQKLLVSLPIELYQHVGSILITAVVEVSDYTPVPSPKEVVAVELIILAECREEIYCQLPPPPLLLLLRGDEQTNRLSLLSGS
jgi:hypothetical protein